MPFPLSGGLGDPSSHLVKLGVDCTWGLKCNRAKGVGEPSHPQRLNRPAPQGGSKCRGGCGPCARRRAGGYASVSGGRGRGDTGDPGQEAARIPGRGGDTVLRLRLAQNLAEAECVFIQDHLCPRESDTGTEAFSFLPWARWAPSLFPSILVFIHLESPEFPLC